MNLSKIMSVKTITSIIIGIVLTITLVSGIRHITYVIGDHIFTGYNELGEEVEYVDVVIEQSMDEFNETTNWSQLDVEYSEEDYTEAKEKCAEGEEYSASWCDSAAEMEYTIEQTIIVDAAELAIEEITSAIDEFSKLRLRYKDLEPWYDASLAYYNSVIVFFNDIITSLEPYGDLEVKEFESYREDISDSLDAMWELNNYKMYTDEVTKIISV